MRGDNGQKCPDCGGPMELNENRASDGREMFGLSCRTHGRHTEWYLNRASALVAPVIRKRTPHSEPIADAPADLPPMEKPNAKGRRAKGQEPRNARELAEDAMADLVKRTGEQP